MGEDWKRQVRRRLPPEWAFSSQTFSLLFSPTGHGAGDENGDHDNKGVGVAKHWTRCSARESLDQAEEQSQSHRTRQITKTTDHADDESSGETSPMSVREIKSAATNSLRFPTRQH